MRKQKCDVIFLQETHCHSRKQELIWGEEWGGQSVWGWGTHNSKGVAILFLQNTVYDYNIISNDRNGRVVALDLKFQNEELRLLNIYGPNNPAERHEFYNTDVKLLFETEQDIIWGGDYNCTLNPSIDRKHISFNSSVDLSYAAPRRHVIDRGTESLHDLISHNNLEDVWRRRNPHTRKYSWRHDSKG